MLLTKIQKLLNGERRRRKSGVILDFVVGVFQQRQEDPHVDSTAKVSGCGRDDETQ